MPIIDAHVHLFANFAPMEPFADIGRLDRLLYLMDQCEVEKAVVLSVEEYSATNNQDCAQWGRAHPDRLAVLVDVPLHESTAAEQVLRAREEFGAVGTSYYAPNPNESLQWLLEEPCEPLWQAYQDTGLACNLQLFPVNYGPLVELAWRYPQIDFVANHLGLPALPGGPDPDDETYGGLLQGADCANLAVKASGFYAAAANQWDFRCPQARRYFRRLLEGLGPDRLLWGSDWMPVGRFLTYRQSLETLRIFTADLDPVEQTKILGGNAARVYGI
ncbi:MAG: amidohydrolase family protein [Candidatus Latescibacteria bacterium]|nr:amidohydrolase family protein [Candidatus Latescibacterota bacterium]